MLCIHPVHPCYYYSCEKKNLGDTNNESLKEYKCAKGLIFDEKNQRCIWALPWQGCQDELFKTTTPIPTRKVTKTTTRELIENVSKSNKVLSLSYDSKETLKSDESKKDFDPTSLFKVLSSESARKAYLIALSDKREKSSYESNLNNIKEPSSEEVANQKREKSNFSRLFYEKLDIKPDSGDDDFNVTIDNNDLIDADEEQIEQDRYAYIIVPIKVSKNNKLPNFSIKKKPDAKKKKAGTKNYQGSKN